MFERKKLFSDEPSNSALKVISLLIERSRSGFISPLLERGYRLQPFRFISSLLERSHRLQPFRLKTDGIIKISGELFQLTRSNIGTTSECIMDLSIAGLRKLVDFPVKGECRRIVPPSEVEAEFLKQTGRKYKKDAWQDIAPWFGFSLTHSQPRSEGWIMDDFNKFSLEGHPDGYALDKQVRLVINQVQRMVEAEQRTKAVRLEKEALQQQYTKDKVEWETKNMQLIKEVGQLDEEKKRNATREG
ncbi:hypothetical protein R1flu_012516 [Riccia fluitans]|uniref:Uncharacterized protein n=1 Tax=Riccia fluitans TaxID=41844 RepID=A0ABD1ZDA7_9MARC